MAQPMENGIEAVEEEARAPSFPPLADLQPLHDFLIGLCSCAFAVDPSLLREAIRDPEVADKLEAFAGMEEVRFLVLHKLLSSSGDLTIDFLLEISSREASSSSVAFIKKGGLLDSRPIHLQLLFLDLGQSDPIDALHCYVHASLVPFFQSFVTKSKKYSEQQKDSETGISIAKAKMGELEAALLSLKREVEIPEVHLPLDPSIRDAMAQAKDKGRPVRISDLGDVVKEAKYLNTLQMGVQRWILEVQKLVNIDRDVDGASASEEITFWLLLERSLKEVSEALRESGIGLTLSVLKDAKRASVYTNFERDTNLKPTLQRVRDYNKLFNGFPIAHLKNAKSVPQITAAIVETFEHLQKFKETKYPIARLAKLIEALSRDMNEQVQKVLSPTPVLTLSFVDFETVIEETKTLWATWDENLSMFKNTITEIGKRRRGADEKMPAKLLMAHDMLKYRIEHLRKLRRTHEDFKNVVATVLPGAPTGREITGAFKFLVGVNAISLTEEGKFAWQTAVDQYEQRIDRAEGQIVNLLRDRLGSAQNSGEMFRIFQKFNPLFIRARIRGAIQEYQSQLLERIKQDVHRLQDKYKVPFPKNMVSRMSALRDLPPLAGSIIWCKQLEEQLSRVMARVEIVLGRDWNDHAEGAKLKSEADAFRSKLGTTQTFNLWVKEVEGRGLQVHGRMFYMSKRTGVRRLCVNFSPDLIVLCKEVRNLTYMGFRIPLKIQSLVDRALNVFPYANSLIEMVEGFTKACNGIDPVLAPVVDRMKAAVQAHIREGIAGKSSYTWDKLEKLSDYVHEMANLVSVFEDKVDDLVVANAICIELIDSLEGVAFYEHNFSVAVNKVQAVIDELVDAGGFSNLNVWVDLLDRRLENILSERLSEAIRIWVEEFNDEAPGADEKTKRKLTPKMRRSPSMILSKDKKNTIPREDMVVSGRRAMVTLRHEVSMHNGVIFVHPPLEQARVEWCQMLNVWMGMLCNLRRLHIKGDVPQDTYISERMKYTSCLTLLPDNVLKTAYRNIENTLEHVVDYVAIWLQYQALWDMDVDKVYMSLGDDLTRWQTLLTEVKASRSTFDTSDSERDFGPVIIDYDSIQGKVNDKYDSWHKQTLTKFGGLLQGRMRSFMTMIIGKRKELERRTIDTPETAEAVLFITLVQTLKDKVDEFEEEVRNYNSGQKLLERQRYAFAVDWLYYDLLEVEWTHFMEILTDKDYTIQSQIPALQQKILREDAGIQRRVKEIDGHWDHNKPKSGDIEPSAAIRICEQFEDQARKAWAESRQIETAKAALELPGADVDVVGPVVEEIVQLKKVWHELERIWNMLGKMRVLPWKAVMPDEVKNELTVSLEKLREMPEDIQAFEAWQNYQEKVAVYMKANNTIRDLRSDAMLPRHWKSLKQKLKKKWELNELVLGDIWDLDFAVNGKLIEEVLGKAMGENALGQFLREVEEYWAEYTFEMVPFQGKCQLIKGWDDLFNKLLEHLNSLNAMKGSPFYKPFKADCGVWDDKLNRLREALDVWVDVQRRWVYLGGIFGGSADIKQLLPNESAKFAKLNTDFISLMKKVERAPEPLKVIQIPGVQNTLDSAIAALTLIQKALGDYLERQRSAFPRFYFVGDEDLLEIIGNQKDITKIQKHLKKMFAGLAEMVFDETAPESRKPVIAGIQSGQGERIMFVKPVVVKDHPKIHEWLNEIEKQMKLSLAEILKVGVLKLRELNAAPLDGDALFEWVDEFPDQLVTLATQVIWTENTERALDVIKAQGGHNFKPLQDMLDRTVRMLMLFADAVLLNLSNNKRRKYEHLMMQLIHERDVIRGQIKKQLSDKEDFEWLYEMRFYFDEFEVEPLERLVIRMSNAHFHYGYEYLGIIDKLVHTPLTDRAFTTLTQALHQKMGGAPFGPAGTGKTESVKALGAQMGLYVLVFCCDENFDFQAMGRIFVGLCQVGAWGCFDEFNRLQEKMLSAVSQQIQTMQEALADGKTEVELLGNMVKLNPKVGVFITMNPGYAGRSNLPDNLKQLVRSIAMTAPDKELIGQVMLFSQGFKTAERLAGKVVPLFKLCKEQVSSQSHYDFGLRSLKSVLVSAGNVKRRKKSERDAQEDNEEEDEPKVMTAEELEEDEQATLIESICQNLMPKLVAQDIPLLRSLMGDVFPGADLPDIVNPALRAALAHFCAESSYVMGDLWVQKVMQLHSVLSICHGVMLVGPAGAGKSSAWRTLLKALEKVDGVEGVAYVIDPKAISVQEMYGSLDPTTREWTDGLLTSIIRAIIDNVRGELNKRHWVIFDGDVDAMWVENMNSTLDDNKLLTLPNGERLALPPCVRIMFEVQDLEYASPATVSRTGMVWFSEETVSLDMLFENYLLQLRQLEIPSNIIDDEEEEALHQENRTKMEKGEIKQEIMLQREISYQLAPMFAEGGLVREALLESAKLNHIMDWTRLRMLGGVFSLIKKGIGNIHQHNLEHEMFHMSPELVSKYIEKLAIYSCVWGFSGSCKIYEREDFGNTLKDMFPSLPFPQGAVLDNEVCMESGEWALWEKKVPVTDVNPDSMGGAIIPTLDTVRHTEVLFAWLADHKPIILCGPPGSGKTMTLFSALKKATNYDMVAINFSATTLPPLILDTLEQKCEIFPTSKGKVMQPAQQNKWIVVFCDEINLPEPDEYGTQLVMTFIRQCIEHGGFWKADTLEWISLRRIQFCGACNPPTDPGRTPLSHRFLRWAPLVLCDYPAYQSLMQIYGTFARGLLKQLPTVANSWKPLTEAMCTFYTESQKKFTPDQQQHYIYSPRELTRWVRGIYDAVKILPDMSEAELVRLWAHEALRLFQDRLVTDEEREWTDKNVDLVASNNFPNLDSDALKRPILFSKWLSRDGEYSSVSREDLRAHLKKKLVKFMEEELDVPLVLFNEVLDHVLRIDRVFNQKQGHVLLIGQSGAGKTILSRFTAWLNGLSVFQIRTSQKYSGEDFDADLREVLRRSGAERERMCFIFDESNIKNTGFLERMNTLLANGEIPGLFEDDDYTQLMNTCKSESSKMGLSIDGEDDLYDWFTKEIILNLHVVFTMNPAGAGWTSRKATSPALFNRCVLNWYGDWPTTALYQVGFEFTEKLPLDEEDFTVPDDYEKAFESAPYPPTHREAVVNGMVYMHLTVDKTNKALAKRQGRVNYVTPRHFLDFISHYVTLYNEKKDELEEQQQHLNGGLQKLVETAAQVEELQGTLAIRKVELQEKSVEQEAKLEQMAGDQSIAEEKQAAANEVAQELEAQNREINTARAVANRDLNKAKPLLEAAAKAVQGVTKENLNEVRSLSNPPANVRLAMEAVMTILGEKKVDWNSIRKKMMDSGFIQSLLNYNTESMTARIRATMKKKYLSHENFNFETINRTSQACGPLCLWCIAQVQYSEVIQKVEPLKMDLARLEDKAKVGQEKMNGIQGQIDKLNEAIGKMEEEYATLVTETNAIKSEMNTTKVKVERSSNLLESLSSESVRWGQESNNFKDQMATVVGDCLVSAASMAYAGFFDQQYRTKLFREWKNYCRNANLNFKEDIQIVSFLSIPDNRLQWQASGLPVDDLCTENAIMLERYNRFPLLIDPAGQAMDFVMKQNEKKKIIKTSFLDANFLKVLETSLRFGTPILVQDVESLDPIVNPILNKEIRRVNGRPLISLGSQDIDYSPAFKIILVTRDPTYNFPPDVCSRVTFVNFTVTPGSLQAQSLSQALKVERPDIDKKRSDILKLQGEFRVRLRHLEDQLLRTLSSSEGKILDNDEAISTLEMLKKDTGEIQEKMGQTEEMMKEITAVSDEYSRLALACSRAYFALEQLGNVHFIYQFSLSFFMRIFDEVLFNNPNLEGKTDYAERLDILINDLLTFIFTRVARSLAHDDHVCLAILFAQFKLEANQTPLPADEFEFLIKGTTQESNLDVDEEMFTALQHKRLSGLATLDAFAELESAIGGNTTAWTRVLTGDSPEIMIPQAWNVVRHEDGTESPKPTKAAILFRNLMVCKCLRPDRVIAAAGLFVAEVFDEEFLHLPPLDFGEIVFDQVNADIPLLLCSMPGFDASGIVDTLSGERAVKTESVSIGSPEGFGLADAAVEAAAKDGTWVMLKNVHLAPQWLVQLEKKLLKMEKHASFRIFLTSEINPKLPVNLLRMGRILLFEPPPGVKANLMRSFSQLPAERMDKAPDKRPMLHFIVSWIHAVLQERLRYIPLGFSQSYEFNDADRRCAYTCMDYWVETAAEGAVAHPNKIPYKALVELMAQSIYGGKVDNEFDCRLIHSVMEKFFNASLFVKGFELVPENIKEGTPPITMPLLKKKEEFLKWIKKLPDAQTPAWIGLPSNAEKVLLAAKGGEAIVKLLKLQVMEDDEDDEDAEEDDEEAERGDQRPAWMRSLHAQVTAWINAFPKNIELMRSSPELVANPLFRCIDREMRTGRRLLFSILGDLQTLDEILRGEGRQTNHIRDLLSSLSKGMIPTAWRKYPMPKSLPVATFVPDFISRCHQLQELGQSHDYGKSGIELGKLFVPEAFITASAQAAAQSQGWSLEDLILTVRVDDVEDLDPLSFIMNNLTVEGTEWRDEALQQAAEPRTLLPPVRFVWLHKSEVPEDPSLVNLPVYLNEARDVLLLDINFPSPATLTTADYYFKGVAVLLCDYSSMAV